MDVVSRRLGALLGLAVAIAVVWAGPAPAITGGTEDGDGHPNVGALLVKVSDSQLAQICSGSVLRASPPEFLTAGHCTEFLTEFLTGLPDPASQVFVSFEPILGDGFGGPIPFDGTPKIGVEPRNNDNGWVTHPAFRTDAGEAKAYDDVGVVHLDEHAVVPTPVTLPPAAGFLDGQAAGGGLVGHIFETVGYGINFIDRSILSHRGFVGKFNRRVVATLPFVSLTPYFLNLQGNTNATERTTDATGLGSGCFGDSGGPAFSTFGSSDQVLQVAVVSSGSPTCGSLNVDQRLDTASVLDFLAPFR
jgi:hypothetical protein